MNRLAFKLTNYLLEGIVIFGDDSIAKFAGTFKRKHMGFVLTAFSQIMVENPFVAWVFFRFFCANFMAVMLLMHKFMEAVEKDGRKIYPQQQGNRKAF